MAQKCDQSDKDVPGKKKTRKLIKLEQKIDIIGRHNREESTAAIRKALKLPESMLRTIRKDREKITAAVKASAGSCPTKVSSGQSNIVVWMEKMLVTWLDHRKCQGLNVTFDDTKNKAMDCYSYLKEKETNPVPDFVASTAGFISLRPAVGSIMPSSWKRLRELMRRPLLASYPDHLRAIIKEDGYKPQQVFNMDKTGLQRKKMPELTYVMRAEKSAPGFKAFKDHFIFLLGYNLMGDCKLKPVMVYHTKNPRALKGYAKTNLPACPLVCKFHWLNDGTHFPDVQQDVLGARVEKVMHISGPPLLYPEGSRQRSLPSPHVAGLAT